MQEKLNPLDTGFFNQSLSQESQNSHSSAQKNSFTIVEQSLKSTDTGIRKRSRQKCLLDLQIEAECGYKKRLRSYKKECVAVADDQLQQQLQFFLEKFNSGKDNRLMIEWFRHDFEK